MISDEYNDVKIKLMWNCKKSVFYEWYSISVKRFLYYEQDNLKISVVICV